MEEAMYLIAIAKPGPETGREPQIVAGAPAKEKAKTAKQTHYVIRNQQLDRKNKPKTNPNKAAKSFGWGHLLKTNPN